MAASLIPFLENDDANRALMGSNMQKQAVPLIQTDAPLVGTGMEAIVAVDSGAVVVARRSGVVEQIDGTRIVVRATEETDPTKPGVDIYRLQKFQRSNTSTCINQRPLVRVGDRIAAGDVMADGPSTELGELALGRNTLVAFMPWNGYNFEDSILISERIVRDDVFTSIHLEEFEVMARDTKLGPEEITRDIPNVGEEALRNLDEAGIVAIGAEVLPGDILVGKVTPKGESPMTPEEKLLRAIFGEKASDVRDTSLRLPPGVAGTIVEVRVFNRHGVDKDERALAIERAEIDRLGKDRDDEFGILNRNMTSRLRTLLVGKTAVSGPKGLGRGKIEADKLEEISPGLWWQIAVDDDKVMTELEAMRRQFDEARKRLDRRFEDKVDKLQRGDELPPGVMKMVKVFVAVKRKLQPGRQDGRPSRQQGGHLQDPADRGHAVSGRRHPRGHRAEPAGRALAHERRPDLRDPPGLGRRRPRQAGRGSAGGLAERRPAQGADRLPARHLRRRRGTAGKRRGARRAGPEPVEGHALRHPGVRRRPHRRHREPAGKGRPRSFGPVLPATTARPASSSSARSRSATSTC